MVGLPAPTCKPSSATTETGSLVKCHLELAVRSMARVSVDNIPHNVSSKTAGHRGKDIQNQNTVYLVCICQIHRYNII